MDEEKRLVSTERAGDRRWGATRRLRTGVVADESAPTVELHGLGVLDRAVEWAVIMPAGVTGYDLSLYKWVKTGARDGDIGVWILDATYASLTASVLKIQAVNGHLVAARISNIGGVVGDGFTVCYTPVNAPVT